MINDIDLEYTQEELVKLSLDIADNKIFPDEISVWLKSRERFLNV